MNDNLVLTYTYVDNRLSEVVPLIEWSRNDFEYIPIHTNFHIAPTKSGRILDSYGSIRGAVKRDFLYKYHMVEGKDTNIPRNTTEYTNLWPGLRDDRSFICPVP